MRLGEEGIKNYCTGGLYSKHSVCYIGSEAENFIGNINADICFFSSRGYTEDGKITDSSEKEVAIKKAMIKNSDKAYYLCDRSKKNVKYAFNVCALRDIDGIIDET